jgi:hypothetical protein
MRGKKRGENDAAQSCGRLRTELWRGSFRNWPRTKENRKLSTRAARRFNKRTEREAIDGD